MNSLFRFGGKCQVVSSRLNLTAAIPGNSDKRKISNKLYQFFIFQGIDWILSRSLDYCVVHQVENPIICCIKKMFLYFF
jgi:hypothetical protein